MADASAVHALRDDAVGIDVARGVDRAVGSGPVAVAEREALRVDDQESGVERIDDLVKAAGPVGRRALVLVRPYAARAERRAIARLVEVAIREPPALGNRASEVPLTRDARLAAVLVGEAEPRGVQIAEVELTGEPDDGTGMALEIRQRVAGERGPKRVRDACVEGEGMRATG